MDIPIDKEKRFLCVEFPGVVDNVDRAMRCLGGEETINKTYSDSNKRLTCNFRPGCNFCKAVCGDRFLSTKLLLRVRRRKKKKPKDDVNDESKTEEYEYDSRILGLIDEGYKFDTMSDCQYLPVLRNTDGTYRTLRNDIVIQSVEKKGWLDKDVPLFLPPPIFSRIDNPIDYAYRDMQVHREGFTDPSRLRDPRLIGASRQRRPHYTRFASFDDETPEKAMKEAIDKFENKLTDLAEVEKLKQLFQERPVWSKNALMTQVHMSADHYKIILPVVAYFFTTGPWRALWVRLGYDPRKDPSAKKYQLVDFRVRQKSAGDKLGITTKRTTYEYHLPTRVSKPGAGKAATIKQETFSVDWSKTSSEPVDTSSPLGQGNLTFRDSTYKFRPGLVPAYRQMFYQLVDIEEEQIQAILHENDGQEKECTERDGWCVDNYQEKCRNIIASYVQKFLGKSRPKEYKKGRRKKLVKERGTTYAYNEESSQSSTDPIADPENEKDKDQQGESDYDLIEDDGGDEEDEEYEDETMNEMEIEMLDLMSPTDDV